MVNTLLKLNFICDEHDLCRPLKILHLKVNLFHLPSPYVNVGNRNAFINTIAWKYGLNDTLIIKGLQEGLLLWIYSQ